jgi:Undecaprenyl-phosphate glucose phosphotransferase
VNPTPLSEARARRPRLQTPAVLPRPAELLEAFQSATPHQAEPKFGHPDPDPIGAGFAGPSGQRLRLDTWLLGRLLAGADWVMALAVAAAAVKFGYQVDIGAVTLAQASVLLGVVFFMKAGLWMADAYADLSQGEGRSERAVGGVALGVLAAIGFAAVAAPSPLLFLAIGAAAPMGGLMIAGLHALLGLWVRQAQAAGALSETAVVVGATDAAERLIQKSAATQRLRVVAVFDDRADRSPHTVAGAPVLGTIEDLLTWPHLPEMDRIVICVSQKAEARVRALLERLRIAPNRVDLVLDLDGVSLGEPVQLETLADMPTARISGGGLSNRSAAIKRLQDLVFASALLVVFSPVMAVIALLIKHDSPGPILFHQKREGFNNRIITVFKFRTMRHDPQGAKGPFVQVKANDPRVTKLGAFLRRTSLDELPQLLNVILGDMSLVGPRPHAVGMKTGDVRTASIVAEYAHRHRIKPGLTGWAQINGSRGPVEHPEEVRERVRYDLDYIARASFWFDLWIMLRTVPALLGDELRTR